MTVLELLQDAQAHHEPILAEAFKAKLRAMIEAMKPDEDAFLAKYFAQDQFQ